MTWTPRGFQYRVVSGDPSGVAITVRGIVFPSHVRAEDVDLRPAAHHPHREMEEEYEKLFWEDFEAKTKNVAGIQAKILEEIMVHNAGTEYLQRHGFDKETCHLCGFKKLPIIEYADIENDIERIAGGDSSPILCADPVCQLFMSSGTTTGRSKLIPATRKSIELLSKFHKRPTGLKETDLCLAFLFAGKMFKTKGGLTLGTTSTRALRNEDAKQLQKMFVGPYELLLAPDIDQSLYCYLLCGLIQSRQVTRIYAALAYILAEGLRMLEELWKELAEDIRTGTVSSRITDLNLRKALVPLIQPNPDLSDAIYRECAGANGCWNGIIKRLWPKTKCIVTVITGAMAPYVPILRRYGGNIPIVSGDYVCTESVIGFNLNPLCAPEDVAFTMNPEFAYYEFLPYLGAQVGDEKSTETVGLADVKIGQNYELIVTTFAGLYRYKVGDVVQVTGFHNSSPKIAFVHRINAALSVASEKTNESELQRVVQTSSQLLLPVTEELMDFTSHSDISSRPGHYVIFWELKSGNRINPTILHECCNLLEASLNETYKLARARGLIAPLELCIVQRGTFKALLQQSLNRGASATQYKTPRCITNPGLLAILWASIIQKCQTQRDLASWTTAHI